MSAIMTAVVVGQTGIPPNPDTVRIWAQLADNYALKLYSIWLR